MVRMTYKFDKLAGEPTALCSRDLSPWNSAL